MTEDATLIHTLKAHGPEGWAEFYRLHHLSVWRFVHRRVRCRPSADDIVAESFLAALKAISQYQAKQGSLEGWFYGIVRRKLADHLRRYYRDQKHLVFTADPMDHDAATENGPPIDHRVTEALQCLPPVERDVLVWMYQDQISVREMAARLNRSEKAIANLLYRARQHFRENYPAYAIESQNAHAIEPAQNSKK